MSAFWRRLVLPVVLVVVASGCWSQYRGDSGHSGAQATESVLGVRTVSVLAPAWVGTTAAPVVGPVTVWGAAVFAVSGDGTLSAFDAGGGQGCSGTPRTCAPEWTTTVGDLLQSPPAVVDGVAYVQGLNAVYAFDAAGTAGCAGTPKRCAPLWRSTPTGYARSSVTVAYGTVYATGATGLMAFDASGVTNCAGTPRVCAPLWTGDPITPTGDGSPAVAGGTAYVSDGTTLFAYDAHGVDGCRGTPRVCAPRWRASGTRTAPAVVGGVVYLGGGPTGLSAVDAAGVTNCAGTPKLCAPLWSTTLAASGSAAEPPAVAPGRVDVLIDGTVYAFDAAGVVGCGGAPRVCAPRWRSAPPLPGTGGVTGAPTVANGVVYTGGPTRLRAYDASGIVNCASQPVACDPLWTGPPAAAPWSPPVVLAGSLYAGSTDGVHAFRAAYRAPAPTVAGLAPRPVRSRTTPVRVTGTGFVPGLTVTTTVPGATVSAPTALTGTGFTVDVTVPATVPPATYALRVTNPDQGLATTSLTFDTTTPADVRSRAGISADPLLIEESPTARAADLDAISTLGVHWISLDVLWNAIEHDGPGLLHWGALDAAVLDARARGLTVIGTPSYSPPWAVGPACPADQVAYGHCLPADPADYARFVATAATRYGSQSTASAGGESLRDTITVWQIWNEPNNQVYARPKPDLDEYTAMLKEASTSIRAVDPDATIITGGMSPAPDATDGVLISPMTWTRGLYLRGARDYFDAVGHHPYSFPTNPLEAHWWNPYTQTRSVYDVMVEFGDGAKKVWGTEMGVPTGTSVFAMSEADQAQWVHDYYLGWNTDFAVVHGAARVEVDPGPVRRPGRGVGQHRAAVQRRLIQALVPGLPLGDDDRAALTRGIRRWTPCRGRRHRTARRTRRPRGCAPRPRGPAARRR